MKVLKMSLFIQELARSFDAQVGQGGRDRFLRDVGRQMGSRLTLPPCESLEMLELEMNALFDLIGWGRASLDVSNTDRKLVIKHTGLPVIASMGEPSGCWLAAALAGLYSIWMEQQPDSLSDARIRWEVEKGAGNAHVITLTYGR